MPSTRAPGVCLSGSCLCKPCQSCSRSRRCQTPTIHPPRPYTTTARPGPVRVPSDRDAPNALPCACSLQPAPTHVPLAASSSTGLVPGGLSWQGPCCTAWCHSSAPVNSTGQPVRCCGADGLGLSGMLTWHGLAVPLACRVPRCPQQKPTRHGDPGRSPLSVGNNRFSHRPQMLGLLPAISARPSLPPSFPPAFLPGWDQWSQRGCRGSCSGAPSTAAALRAWPDDHWAGTTSTLPPDRVGTGVVAAGQTPRESAMPGLRHEMRRGR